MSQISNGMKTYNTKYALLLKVKTCEEQLTKVTARQT